MQLISQKIAAEDESGNDISREGCVETGEEDDDRILRNDYFSRLKTLRLEKEHQWKKKIEMFIETKEKEDTKEARAIEGSLKYCRGLKKTLKIPFNLPIRI